MDGSSANEIDDVVDCANDTLGIPVVLTAGFSNSYLQDSSNKIVELIKPDEQSHSHFVNRTDVVQTDGDSSNLQEMLISTLPAQNQNSENGNVSLEDSSYYVMIDGDTIKKVDASNIDLSKAQIEHFEIGVDDENSAQEMKTENQLYVPGDDDTGVSVALNENNVKNFTTGAESDIQRLHQNYKVNSFDNINNDESNLDNSLGEENILVHLSKQQQQFLCSTISIDQDSYFDGSTGLMTYRTPDTSYSQGSSSVSDHYTLLPSLLTQQAVSIPWNPSTPQQMISDLQTNTLRYTTGLPSSTITQNQSFTTSTPGVKQTSQQVPGSGCYYTPHPKSGKLLYLSEDTASPHIYQNLVPITPASSNRQDQRNSSDFVTPNIRPKHLVVLSDTKSASKVKLNSSGEESDKSQSSEDPSTSYNSSVDSVTDRELDMKFDLFSNEEDGREQHNLKERRRRARIKDACDVMRKLVPGMSDKTDKATVFEFGARYIHYLKSFVGSRHDKDFLIKYSPY